MSDDIFRYVAGAMPLAEEEAFEARLFDDAALADAARRVHAFIATLQGMAQQGPVVPVLHPATLTTFLASTSATEHRPVDGKVATRIGDEAFVVAHLPADLGQARWVDVVFCTPEGTPYFRVHEAPFAADEVVVVCSSHVARAAGTLRVRVVDHDEQVRGEVVIENLALE